MPSIETLAQVDRPTHERCLPTRGVAHLRLPYASTSRAARTKAARSHCLPTGSAEEKLASVGSDSPARPASRSPRSECTAWSQSLTQERLTLPLTSLGPGSQTQPNQ